MKKFIPIIILITNILYSQGRNSNFDFSGMDQFWKIVNIFEANREPSPNDWNKLFNTPGYNILTNGEFRKDFFIKNFRLVYKSSEKNNLDNYLKSGNVSHHISHYLKVKENKKLVEDQITHLKRKSFNKIAIDRTLEFLPQNRVNEYPPVSFLIFESNGRGSSPIVVDVAASIEWDFVSFLAHEFHHWYRNNQLQFNYSKIEKDDFDIVKVLSMIEAEGIADMVDKKDWFTKPNSAISEYARGFIRDVGRTPSVIVRMDEILSNIYKNTDNKKSLSRSLYNLLPQKGHTTGYFMASLILEKYSRSQLVKCVGNPFEFILLYNKSAKISSGNYPTFSDESIKLIAALNSKYTLK